MGDVFGASRAAEENAGLASHSECGMARDGRKGGGTVGGCTDGGGGSKKETPQTALGQFFGGVFLGSFSLLDTSRPKEASI